MILNIILSVSAVVLFVVLVYKISRKPKNKNTTPTDTHDTHSDT